MEAKKLFNPDAIVRRGLIGGETTNIMILSNNNYDWSFKLYKTMMGNFWIPEEISLGQDKMQYDNVLTDAERYTFDKVISFLVFLDSLQTANLPNINDFITEPEVNLLLNIQTYQEALHSQSYGYILESIMVEKARKTYDIAITDEYLVKRNRYIADLYQEFIDHQSEQGFAKVMMANYILEGIYFYAGFSFFYNLARFGKLTGVGTEIKYINRDELTHLALFQNMFRELRREKPEIFTEQFEEQLRQMMKGAVEQEIEWAAYAIGDNIQGLSMDLLDKYIRYLSNYRLKAINLQPLYPEITVNPLPYIDQFTNFNQTKTDFFEEKPINYAKGGSDLDLDSLDDLDL